MATDCDEKVRLSGVWRTSSIHEMTLIQIIHREKKTHTQFLQSHYNVDFVNHNMVSRMCAQLILY